MAGGHLRDTAAAATIATQRWLAAADNGLAAGKPRGDRLGSSRAPPRAKDLLANGGE